MSWLHVEWCTQASYVSYVCAAGKLKFGLIHERETQVRKLGLHSTTYDTQGRNTINHNDGQLKANDHFTRRPFFVIFELTRSHSRNDFQAVLHTVKKLERRLKPNEDETLTFHHNSKNKRERCNFTW